jgi:hypothetical protein
MYLHLRRTWTLTPPDPEPLEEEVVVVEVEVCCCCEACWAALMLLLLLLPLKTRGPRSRCLLVGGLWAEEEAPLLGVWEKEGDMAA